MVQSHNLGFPRIGAFRELKKAVEGFWKGAESEEALQDTARELRSRHWKLQQDAGIDLIPSNDFSFYDQVLDMITLLGAVPERYEWQGGHVDLDTYFAMARGKQGAGVDVVAMEMTKWFDTNYHYIVPEFKKGMKFSLSSRKIFDEFKEAKELGIITKPVLIGPISFLLLGKSYDKGLKSLDLLPALLPIYEEILAELAKLGAEWVQIDEPFLAMDIEDETRKAYEKTYKKLSEAADVNILLATYFEGLRDNMETALNLPVAAVHLDLERAPYQLDSALEQLPNDKALSLGVIDGRNIWRADISAALKMVQRAVDALGSDRVLVGPSCSLLHCPVDLDSEPALDQDLKNWLAFAKQKLQEITLVAEAAHGNKDALAFEHADAAMRSRSNSTRVHNPEVKQRVAAIDDAMARRAHAFPARAKQQHAALALPPLPTTTIGSFPQTKDIRQVRAQYKAGNMSRHDYIQFMEQKTEEVIRLQEELGIDVLVHGEFERNDMVEYFGEKLHGFAFTKFGWVQSYGSRCVKPPILFGDVSRSEAMTVRWSAYAQGLTERYVKGMLTGPVTILQWSFVRNDQPREDTCRQIALAIRDEVQDLEAAGIKIIQIDEPAFREGLPLRKGDWAHYLGWAVESFRISASVVEDTTQIHTHMCYSEFNDIIGSIADLDADVISIETSRSAMELLDAFVEFKYPNEIGPGVYDIHSPRIPKTEEMQTLLHKALEVLKPEQVWVNPDCGLKTRGWTEVEPALKHMVDAAKSVRKELGYSEQDTQSAA